jgi:UDP-glucose 4-epimerase
LPTVFDPSYLPPMKSIIVTGGAGYIGSVTVQALLQQARFQIHVLDNLTTGHRGALDRQTIFHQVDLTDRAATSRLFSQIRPEAVIHFAASSLVGPSVTDPLPTYDNNILGTLSLLHAMRESACRQLVFSSTAAVYGEPQTIPLPETHPIQPANPYGTTKALIERLLADAHQAYALRFVTLRYFNAAGAIPQRGEDHRPESHLIPLVLQTALGQRSSISVFGTDYDTDDGTAIRDYVHVADLASAHLAALEWLQQGGPTLTCNLGTGTGYSVAQVINAARRITGQPIPVQHHSRRPGDPSRLVAAPHLAQTTLHWQPTHSTLDQILTDAWHWHQKHPQGYSTQE